MKKLISLYALLCILVSCSQQEFTFVQLTDPQIGFMDETPGYQATSDSFDRCMEMVNGIHPDLVIITGDLIHQPTDSLQCSIYKDIVAKADNGIEVLAVPGNHDMLKYSEESRARYMEFMGYDRFSIIHKGCAFIGIDSNCIKENDTQRAQEQWDWLESELGKAAKCRHRFIFLHCPVIRETMDEKEDYFNFPMDERQRYCELFKKYDVDAVFSGHTHIGYETNVDGVQFINAGPVGPSFIDKPGFNVISVGKDGWNCEYQLLKK